MAKQKRPTFKSGRGKEFGTLEQVFDDVWWAWGTTKFAPGMTFPRNMTIIRDGEGLVVIHPVLMPEAEQKKIEALGKIEHIVRLGDFHGMDDHLYVERYSPKAWAPPGVAPKKGIQAEALTPDSHPIENATLLAFENAIAPETMLHVPRHGGILFTCDALQVWDPKPKGLSTIARAFNGIMGFKGRACVGPAWKKQCEPKDGVGFEPKFRELLGLEFKHMISAHGEPIKDTAKADVTTAVNKVYRR